MKRVMMWAMANLVLRGALFSALLSAPCYASTNVTVNVTSIEFTQVERLKNGRLVNSGKPMPYIPLWFPDDGKGQGRPIYHPWTPAFEMSFAGTNIQVTLLGTKHRLTRVLGQPPLYRGISSDLTVRLNHEPSDDTNDVKHVSATVSLPALGVSDSLYECEETAAGSSVFAHRMECMEMVYNSPSNSQPAKLELTVDSYVVASVYGYSLAQAGINAFLFTNDVISVRLLGNPAYYTTLKVALSQCVGFNKAAPYISGWSNTVVQFKRCGKSSYRNYESPTATNAPPERVPRRVAFYVEVHADNLKKAARQHVISVTVDTDQGVVEIGRLSLAPVGNGVWQTVKPAVVLGGKHKTSEITPSDRSSCLFLQAPPCVSHTGGFRAGLVLPDEHPFPTWEQLIRSKTDSAKTRAAGGRR